MPNSLDTWTFQNFQVSKFFGVNPADVGDWFNSDFYDAYEYFLVADEIDRRALNEG